MKTNQRIQRTLHRYAVNISGVVSFTASSALALATGNLEALVAWVMDGVGETLHIFKGHKTAGYSAGCAAIAIADLTFAFNEKAGSTQQSVLLAMAAAYTVGALKYPFQKAAVYFQHKPLDSAARIFPAITGASSFSLNLTGAFAAAASGNRFMALIFLGWLASDILEGRLYQKNNPAYRFLRQLRENRL